MEQGPSKKSPEGRRDWCKQTTFIGLEIDITSLFLKDGSVRRCLNGLEWQRQVLH